VHGEFEDIEPGRVWEFAFDRVRKSKKNVADSPDKNLFMV
jgi:hypothetical protein